MLSRWGVSKRRTSVRYASICLFSSTSNHFIISCQGRKLLEQALYFVLWVRFALKNKQGEYIIKRELLWSRPVRLTNVLMAKSDLLQKVAVYVVDLMGQARQFPSLSSCCYVPETSAAQVKRNYKSKKFRHNEFHYFKYIYIYIGNRLWFVYESDIGFMWQ